MTPIKKRISLSLFFTLLTAAAFAQNIDSVTLVNAIWHKQKIAPKTYLLTHHFDQKNLFSANQYISCIEIKRKGKAPVFAFGNEVKEKKTTSVFGKELHALAAINGTFFDVANGGSVDFVKMDGAVIKENVLDKNGKRARHQKAAIVIDHKGRLALKKWDNSGQWEHTLPEPHVMLSGPLLLLGRHTETLDSTSFTTARHPRTAIGIKPNGKVLLLTVDGRQENAAGMSLPELSKIMRWLGCTDAINLDGGGSTTMWIEGIGSGVVNFPSDNKKWDHEGERKVANVVILKKK